MKKKLFVILFLTSLFTFSQEERKISGYVTDGAEPLEGVNIHIKNSALGTTTDSKGYYEITAYYSDKLIYSYQGKEKKTFRVNDISKAHNVVLLPEINALDGVIVERNKYRLQSQKALFDTYNIEKSIIKNKFLLMDKKISGYHMEIREADDINYAGVNILAVLQSMFAAAKLTGSPDDPRTVIYMRGTTSIKNPRPAIYDVDGIIYEKPPLFLDIKNLKRIARLPGLNGNLIYGFIGAGGVFIINTKSANLSPTKDQLAFRAEQNSKKTYKVKTIKYGQETKNWPIYLVDLSNTDDFESATTTYSKYKKLYQNESYFTLDAVQYFLDKHAAKEFHKQIIDNSGILEKNNIELSRALGLILEYYGDFETARLVYLDVLKKWPHSPQSYLDLAQTYIETDEALKAFALIGRYNNLVEKKLLSPELGGSHDIFKSEFDDLSKSMERSERKSKPIVSETAGTRITFEWNDDQAGFLFHFVDPSKNFFIWDNSAEESDVSKTNFPQIATTKEYFIPENAENGTWRINVNYLGNGRIKPTYLKATVQYDYGLATERKETKLYRLSIKGQVQELFSVYKNNLIVSAN